MSGSVSVGNGIAAEPTAGANGGLDISSLAVTLDPRTAVLIGAGQYVHRAEGMDDALEPAALMELAIRAAAADAGLADPPAFDSIRVVSSLSWKYANPAWFLAERLGQSPRQLGLHDGGR